MVEKCNFIAQIRTLHAQTHTRARVPLIHTPHSVNMRKWFGLGVCVCIGRRFDIVTSERPSWDNARVRRRWTIIKRKQQQQQWRIANARRGKGRERVREKLVIKKKNLRKRNVYDVLDVCCYCVFCTRFSLLLHLYWPTNKHSHIPHTVAIVLRRNSSQFCVFFFSFFSLLCYWEHSHIHTHTRRRSVVNILCVAKIYLATEYTHTLLELRAPKWHFHIIDIVRSHRRRQLYTPCLRSMPLQVVENLPYYLYLI